MSAGYHLLVTVDHVVAERLATVRMASPTAGDTDVLVDLLFASSGIEPEIAAAAELVEIVPGLTVPTATTGHLIALKLLARDDHRPQDVTDLRLLAAAASDTDRDTARQAVQLIEARGFSRDRDLLAALDALDGSG